MKPHIVRRGFVWFCGLRGEKPTGYGINPTMALKDWRRIMASQGRF
ncbi:MAG TPA: hypothetical protein VFM98_01750 [Ramlibacter sp.]|nr:hypothetical protein [Ramlibacter sp.]HET8744299.1 hypothetical protein [Ramlibacter sp.]